MAIRNRALPNIDDIAQAIREQTEQRRESDRRILQAIVESEQRTIAYIDARVKEVIAAQSLNSIERGQS